MSSREMLREEFKTVEARRDYAAALLDSFLALQIKVLRQQRDWSQEKLAREAGLHQSQISAMEQASHSAWSLRTLRKLADAFDLALIVRFESFGKLLDETSSMSRSALERPSFDDDPVFFASSSATALAQTDLPVTPPANFAYYKMKRQALGSSTLQATIEVSHG